MQLLAPLTATLSRVGLLAVAVALGGCDLAMQPGDSEAPCDATSVTPAITGTFVHELRSEYVGDDFRVSVSVPEGFVPGLEPDGGPYPVIYVLDGYWAFGGVTEFVRTQASYSLPHAIVVGISYQDDSTWGRLQRRTRDFTPTSWELYAAVNDRDLAQRLELGDSAPFDSYPMGGADAFLQFIQHELQPMIEASYPADPDDATIIGSSFGGLFATYALFTAPEVFQRYVIISPGLNWDDALLSAREEEFAATHEDLPAKVFFAAGSREREERLARAQYGDPLLAELEESYRMVERVEALAGALTGRGYPSLEVEWKVIEGENHTSVALPGTSIGLRAVFDSQYFFSL